MNPLDAAREARHTLSYVRDVGSLRREVIEALVAAVQAWGPLLRDYRAIDNPAGYPDVDDRYDALTEKP